MREITEKTLHPLVPDVFITAVHDQLRQYGGTRLAEPRPCPHCESRQYRKNGYQDRTFAQLITAEGFERVTVNVQLYECTNCGSRFQGDISELFYEECHYAKPIVDLCLFHAAENPFTYSSFPGCCRARQSSYNAHDSASFALGPVIKTCSLTRGTDRSLASHTWFTLP